jgi:hypothetical protein
MVNHVHSRPCSASPVTQGEEGPPSAVEAVGYQGFLTRQSLASQGLTPNDEKVSTSFRAPFPGREKSGRAGTRQMPPPNRQILRPASSRLVNDIMFPRSATFQSRLTARGEAALCYHVARFPRPQQVQQQHDSG